MASDKREPRRVAVGAILLVMVGSGCGLAFNSLRPSGLRLNTTGPLCKRSQPQAKFTTLDDAAAALQAGAALFVDARPAEEYAEGHIQGAISLPFTEFDDVFPTVRPQLEAASLIITYCSGEECRASEFAADRLVEMGLEAVEILPEGFGAWEAAGYPVATEEEP